MPQITIDQAVCIRCGQCVRHCPYDTLRTGSDGFVRQPYPDDCLGMLLCARFCPVGAIIRKKEVL